MSEDRDEFQARPSEESPSRLQDVQAVESKRHQDGIPAGREILRSQAKNGRVNRNLDRHRPGYYAEYQRKRRARIKAANAEQAQMVTINKLLDAS